MDSMVATTTHGLHGVDDLNLSVVPGLTRLGTTESHQFPSLERDRLPRGWLIRFGFSEEHNR